MEKITVVWALSARDDLRKIYYWVKKHTESIQLAQNVKNDIIKASQNIEFVEQYQVDEFLESPFRRIIVRHYRIVYEVESQSKIRILQVFDTHQHPKKLKKR